MSGSISGGGFSVPVNINGFPTPNSPVVDTKTGLVTPVWAGFLQNLGNAPSGQTLITNHTSVVGGSLSVVNQAGLTLGTDVNEIQFVGALTLQTLSNSGTVQVNVGGVDVIAPTNGPQIVQSVGTGAVTMGTYSLTLEEAPTPGNVLVLLIATSAGYDGGPAPTVDNGFTIQTLNDSAWNNGWGATQAVAGGINSITNISITARAFTAQLLEIANPGSLTLNWGSAPGGGDITFPITVGAGLAAVAGGAYMWTDDTGGSVTLVSGGPPGLNFTDLSLTTGGWVGIGGIPAGGCYTSIGEVTQTETVAVNTVGTFTANGGAGVAYFIAESVLAPRPVSTFNIQGNGVQTVYNPYGPTETIIIPGLTLNTALVNNLSTGPGLGSTFSSSGTAELTLDIQVTEGTVALGAFNAVEIGPNLIVSVTDGVLTINCPEPPPAMSVTDGTLVIPAVTELLVGQGLTLSIPPTLPLIRQQASFTASGNGTAALDLVPLAGNVVLFLALSNTGLGSANYTLILNDNVGGKLSTAGTYLANGTLNPVVTYDDGSVMMYELTAVDTAVAPLTIISAYTITGTGPYTITEPTTNPSQAAMGFFMACDIGYENPVTNLAPSGTVVDAQLEYSSNISGVLFGHIDSFSAAGTISFDSVNSPSASAVQFFFTSLYGVANSSALMELSGGAEGGVGVYYDGTLYSSLVAGPGVTMTGEGGSLTLSASGSGGTSLVVDSGGTLYPDLETLVIGSNLTFSAGGVTATSGTLSGSAGGSGGTLVVGGEGPPTGTVQPGIIYEQQGSGAVSSRVYVEDVVGGIAQLAALQLSDGAAHLYIMQDATGTTVMADAAAVAANGTYGGTYTLESSPLVSMGTYSVYLNSGYASVPFINSPTSTAGAWTLEFVIKPTGLGANPRLCANAHTDTANNGFQIYNYGELDINFTGSGTTTISPSSNMVNGNVYHVVVTYDGVSVLDYYINGVLQGTRAVSGACLGTNDFALGYNPNYGSDYTPGYYSNLAFYAGALTATQVLNHYTAVTSGGSVEMGWRPLDRQINVIAGTTTVSGVLDIVLENGLSIAGYSSDNTSITLAAGSMELVQGTDTATGVVTIGSNLTLSGNTLTGATVAASPLLFEQNGTSVGTSGTLNVVGGTLTETAGVVTLVIPASGGTSGVMELFQGTNTAAGTITIGSNLTLSGNTLSGSAGGGGGSSTTETISLSGATTTIVIGGNAAYMLELSTLTTLAFAGSAPGTYSSSNLVIKQAGTAAAKLTWPAAYWPGGVLPVLTTLVGNTDIIHIASPGDGNYYGNVVGSNFFEYVPSAAYDTVVLSDAPVAYWKLSDQTGAGTVSDFSGNNLTGTISGGVTLGQTAINTGLGNSAYFDGSSGEITVPNSPFLNITTANLSIEAWIYPTYVAGTGDWLSKGYNGGYRIRTETGFQILINGGSYTLATPTEVSNLPYHVVAVASSTGMSIYVNGTLSVSNTSVAACGDTTSPLYLGSTGTSGEYYTGRLSNVAVYNHALTAAQVANHYNAGIA